MQSKANLHCIEPLRGLNELLGRSARRKDYANSWNMQQVQWPRASARVLGWDRAASTNMREVRCYSKRPIRTDYSDGETLTEPNRRGWDRRMQGDI